MWPACTKSRCSAKGNSYLLLLKFNCGHPRAPPWVNPGLIRRAFEFSLKGRTICIIWCWYTSLCFVKSSCRKVEQIEQRLVTECTIAKSPKIVRFTKSLLNEVCFFFFLNLSTYIIPDLSWNVQFHNTGTASMFFFSLLLFLLCYSLYCICF